MQTCPLTHKKIWEQEREKSPSPLRERDSTEKEKVSLSFPLEKLQTFGEKIGQNKYEGERQRSEGKGGSGKNRDTEFKALGGPTKLGWGAKDPSWQRRGGQAVTDTQLGRSGGLDITV
jgi:hypothetical protein